MELNCLNRTKETIFTPSFTLLLYGSNATTYYQNISNFKESIFFVSQKQLKMNRMKVIFDSCFLHMSYHFVSTLPVLFFVPKMMHWIEWKVTQLSYSFFISNHRNRIQWILTCAHKKKSARQIDVQILLYFMLKIVRESEQEMKILQ